ncbi:enoyl-[acyl-carrier-protein] reductase FabK [Clostridium tetani]|uniref:Probable nitronate monooxygenase n=1 Tax=Clostridium tetani TaxID=1513 RepID=A0A4Q0VC88_CLOTA|nr:enoyl-[acyl-carrier-protein] reductase FabK [Clostridium tetani]KGI43463.1 2-nitropropane dioxygenase [Clostridium tetani]RXI46627.1 enoyl-[acyl-carrier-protein] reductase FabK [Clostridium tetani]RXI74205.1 enoyl-[acyl-carrier-protein] reductase FabK [Clostridium tetani]BDR68469.1 2-nitropropane dioxygenase [Clostridium tetani]BDR74030.1 2-nitropropane dioxygenase [Clostridium tetani]
MKENAFCNMIGLDYPIIQGAMAWIADSSLASAVSNAGGLGIIASGNQPVDMVKKEIRKTKELTNKPFGVNIMLLSDNAEELAKLICEENIKVVTTGAGNPGKYIDMWKKSGVKVIPVVASVALAKRMERAGADALIVEGCEAGGHIGELTTMALLPQVIDAVNIPVIAAGGIGDKRGVLAAFVLGAIAVQVGTRFLVAKECNIHRNYKEKVLKAKDIDTVVTGRNTGHPVRVLRNRLTRKYQILEKENAPMEEFEKITKGALIKAVKEGDIQTGSLMAGQIAGLISKEQSCKEIIKEMFDFKEVIKRLENFYE